MKEVKCDICEKEDIPTNESLKVDDKIYCNTCFETSFPNKTDLEGKKVDKEFDPTICASCGKDFGRKTLNKISNYPICDECDEKIRNRAFPNWVKLFFAVIIAIVAFSFIWNWRFYESYNKINKSIAAFHDGDLQNASILMQTASNNVPEVTEVESIANYYKALYLLSSDKSAEALVELEKCKDVLPEEYNINQLILQARMGAGFDSKNYDQFLLAAKEFLNLDKSFAMSWASVASAYACKYAVSNVDSIKESALLYLSKAKQIDDTTKEMLEYYNRIEHRIFTRNVISTKEFQEKYPTGWDKTK